MNHEVGKLAGACGTCGVEVSELRRGRCWSCYTRWAHDRPVGLGACCAVCDDRRRENLCLVEVQGRSLPLCHLCAARVGKLELVPHSVEGLRAALRRDRRQVERRGADGQVIATATERRAAHRRSQAQALGPGGIGFLADEISAIELSELDLDLDLCATELAVDDDDIVEATVVAQAPRPPAIPS